MVVHHFPELPEKGSADDLMKAVKAGGEINKGTAFAVAVDKFVTCHHVIKDLNAKTMRLSGAPDYTADLPMNIHNVIEILSDPELDVALLKTETRPRRCCSAKS